MRDLMMEVSEVAEETPNIIGIASSVPGLEKHHRTAVGYEENGSSTNLATCEFIDGDFDEQPTRRKRREWIQKQLAIVKESGQLHSTLVSSSETSCWICARRGLFEICPQVSSQDHNPRITIEDHLNAALYAAEAANTYWQREQQRLVFYTDMAAVNGTWNDPDIAGAAITYKRILRDTDYSSNWVDISYGIIGSNRPDKVELYAIGLALETAVSEIQHLKTISNGLISCPTVVIITDSQAALYFIHDFTWKGTTPFLFSQETFMDLMEPINTLIDLNVPLELHWVPSHTNVEGNCRADVLAGKASNWMMSNISIKNRRKLLSCQVIRIPGPEFSRPALFPSAIATDPDEAFLLKKTQAYDAAAEQI